MKKLRDMLVPLGEMVNEQTCPYTVLLFLLIYLLIYKLPRLRTYSLTYLLPTNFLTILLTVPGS